MHRRRSRLGRKVGQELLEKPVGVGIVQHRRQRHFQHKIEQCHQQVNR